MRTGVGRGGQVAVDEGHACVVGVAGASDREQALVEVEAGGASQPDVSCGQRRCGEQQVERDAGPAADVEDVQVSAQAVAGRPRERGLEVTPERWFLPGPLHPVAPGAGGVVLASGRIGVVRLAHRPPSRRAPADGGMPVQGPWGPAKAREGSVSAVATVPPVAREGSRRTEAA